jgi:hypothetical protein
MVFSNYRELVRPADAKKWFTIEPDSAKAAGGWEADRKGPEDVPTNIVPLPKVAVV